MALKSSTEVSSNKPQTAKPAQFIRMSIGPRVSQAYRYKKRKFLIEVYVSVAIHQSQYSCTKTPVIIFNYKIAEISAPGRSMERSHRTNHCKSTLDF